MDVIDIIGVDERFLSSVTVMIEILFHLGCAGVMQFPFSNLHFLHNVYPKAFTDKGNKKRCFMQVMERHVAPLFRNVA